MKRLFLSLTVVLSVGLFFSSCGEGEANMEHHEKHAAEGEMNYQCPMECEGEKVYDEPGICPVCKMDLEEKE